MTLRRLSPNRMIVYLTFIFCGLLWRFFLEEVICFDFKEKNRNIDSPINEKIVTLSDVSFIHMRKQVESATIVVIKKYCPYEGNGIQGFPYEYLLEPYLSNWNGFIWLYSLGVYKSLPQRFLLLVSESDSDEWARLIIIHKNRLLKWHLDLSECHLVSASTFSRAWLECKFDMKEMLCYN